MAYDMKNEMEQKIFGLICHQTLEAVKGINAKEVVVSVGGKLFGGTTVTQQDFPPVGTHVVMNVIASKPTLLGSWLYEELHQFNHFSARSFSCIKSQFFGKF